MSRVFGGVFIAAGLFGASFSLALIGVFLFFLVGREERIAEMRAEVEKAAPRRPAYVPFGPWSQRFGVGPAKAEDAPVVVDVPGARPEEEVIVDPWGRRWVRRKF